MSIAIKREYPDDYEFIGFFEVEPEMTDEDIPWYYNTLTYFTERAGVSVECIISPAYGDMDLKLLIAGKELTALSVSYINKILFESKVGKETMIVDFPDKLNLQPLILQLKPTVNLSWGTELE
ncbi:MAG: hypothetical protein ABW168_01155 [Sedimenticola sp.]